MTGSAVVVIDMQNGVLAGAFDREGVLARVGLLIERARSAGVPVVFVQHEDEDLPAGSHAWQLTPPVTPLPGDPVVRKRYRDSFVETEFAVTLNGLEVRRLVIAGSQSDYCVSTTMQRAAEEGFDVVLVSDCHTTPDDSRDGVSFSGEQIVAHTNQRMQGLRYPGVSCGVATHDTVTL